MSRTRKRSVVVPFMPSAPKTAQFQRARLSGSSPRQSGPRLIIRARARTVEVAWNFNVSLDWGAARSTHRSVVVCPAVYHCAHQSILAHNQNDARFQYRELMVLLNSWQVLEC